MIVSIDGNETGKTPNEHLAQWMEFLSHKIRCSHSTCKVVVVFTKKDLARGQYEEPKSSDLVRALEESATKVLKSWPFLKNVQHDFVFVSSKTGESFVLLKDILSTSVGVITSRKVPHFFNDISRVAMGLRRMYTPFITFADFKKASAEAIPSGLVGDFWRDCLTFLQESGHIVAPPAGAGLGEKAVICAHPCLLSKAIGLLISSSSGTKSEASPLMTEEEALQKIGKVMSGSIDGTQGQLLLDQLRQFGICLGIPQRGGLLVPLCAPFCDAAPLPHLSESDHT